MDQIRILVVEMDVLIRHPLTQYLREQGCIVLEGRSAADARTLLSARTIAIDIVIINADAPPDAGSALAECVKRASPATEIIAASASGGNNEYPRVLQAIRRQHARTGCD